MIKYQNINLILEFDMTPYLTDTLYNKSTTQNIY